MDRKQQIKESHTHQEVMDKLTDSVVKKKGKVIRADLYEMRVSDIKRCKYNSLSY